MYRLMKAMVLALTVFLASCGGGDGCNLLTGAVLCKSEKNTQKEVEIKIQPMAISVQGMAAEGLAMGQANVNMVCVQGQAQAATDNNGAYTIQANNAVAPCLLQVTSPMTGRRFHSVLVSGTRANITPITEMISATVLAMLPYEVFELDETTRAARLAQMNDQSVASAMGKVVAATEQISGATLTTNVDYLKGSFAAATPVRAGDATDRKLDALVAALDSSGKSLDELSLLVMAKNGLALTQAVKSLLGVATDSLPNCPAARSGDYWLLTSTGYGFFFVQGQASRIMAVTLDGALARASRRFVDNGQEKVERIDFFQRYSGNNTPVPCVFDVAMGNELMEMRVTADGIGLLNSKENTVAVLVPRQPQTSVAALASKNFQTMAFRQVNNATSSYDYVTQLTQWVFGVGGQTVNSHGCSVNAGVVTCSGTADKTLSAQLRSDGAYEFRDPDGTLMLGVAWQQRDQTLLWLSVRNGTNLEPVGMGVALNGGRCGAPAVGTVNGIQSNVVVHAAANRLVNSTQEWLQTASYDEKTGIQQLGLLASETSTNPSDFYIENWGAMGACTSYRGPQALFGVVQPRMMMNIGREFQIGMSTDYSPQKGATLWLSQRSIRE